MKRSSKEKKEKGGKKKMSIEDRRELKLHGVRLKG